VVGGDPSHSAVQGDIIFRVTTTGDANYVYAIRSPPGAWTTGSHTVLGCVTPAGEVQLYGDGAPLGAPVPLPAGSPIPDLSTGRVWVGNDHNAGIPWYGWVSKALACPFGGDLTHCN
jgi:hypothetical protein